MNCLIKEGDNSKIVTQLTGFFFGGGDSLFTIPLAHEHVCASQVDFKHEKDGIKEF